MDAIWAEDKNKVIGNNGRLPWHLPCDLQFFKEKTMGKTMIMGRKTFESMDKRCLPGRKTVILTTDTNYQAPEEAIVLHSLAEMVEYMVTKGEKLIVIGGTQVFEQLLPYCETLYVTHIDDCFEGDTFAPNIPESFACLEQQVVKKNEDNPVDLVFNTYRKKR